MIVESIQEMYTLEQLSGGQKFTNLVDGYSVRIPYDMKVDMSQSSICATLEDSYRKIRIFKEIFDTDSERLSYLKYSNRFTENTADHKIIKQESYRYFHIASHFIDASIKRSAMITFHSIPCLPTPGATHLHRYLCVFYFYDID